MAEVILFRLAGQILSTLSPHFMNQIGVPWYAKKHLIKLRNKITTIRNVLLHAQELQITNHAVKEWLRRLKVILYEADDLFDELATEALQRDVVINKKTKTKVRHFFTSSNPVLSNYSLGKKVEEIGERLDYICNDMKDFGFMVRALDKPVVKRSEATTSFVDTRKILGRDHDKMALLQLVLLSPDDENVHIIPIVGIGGLGKTTLAQVIFNDNSIKSGFEERAWVCVSDDFSVKRILIEILTVVGEDVMNAGMENLQIRFQARLSGKKFFLILDDVWNDDPVEWEKLKDLLMTGARGSRILVTTRDKKVAKIVRTMETYMLKGLCENDCLSILVKWAFEKGEETKHPNLIQIGRDIVKKCGGVPLAARTLGVLLYSKTSEHEWLLVRDSELWAQVQNENDILPILKLSYDQMPSALKECFGYCSLFKKDEEISKEELMYQWIAHGFIQSSDMNLALEDVCETYLEELLRRSFLEYVDTPLRYKMYARVNYKMHDLVHDLAQYVEGDESVIIKGENVSATSHRVRHVSLDYSSEIPKSLLEQKNLRTIMRTGYHKRGSIEEANLNCRCLRVLDYGTYGGARDLPKNIKKMMYLRYVRYPGVKTIPKSISKLLNLQFLDLSKSQFADIPDYLENLRNLRVLIFSSHELVCLPTSIRSLASLRRLTIGHSERLQSLHMGLWRITSLEHLEISNCNGVEFSDFDFQGLTSLKFLCLSFLDGLKHLPKGLQDSAATLKHLTLDTCSNLTLTEEVLPKLQSLEVLEIMNCKKINCLPKGMPNLLKLNHLVINCERLVEKYQPIEEEWPKIAHVPHINVDRIDVRSP